MSSFGAIRVSRNAPKLSSQRPPEADHHLLGCPPRCSLFLPFFLISDPEGYENGTRPPLREG